MKEKILAFLRARDGFVSGQTICADLGVSRTAVWKCVNALKEEGYEIESVSRKGYRLLKSPDLISEEELRLYMPKGLYPGGIHAFMTIDSTNEEAKRAGTAGLAAPAVFVADQQTAGRGRRGRSWDSPPGEDLFFSILLRPQITPQTASMLTIVAALAGAAALDRQMEKDKTIRGFEPSDSDGGVDQAVCQIEGQKRETGVFFQIKWPNDLLLHDKKICGILTEMAVEMGEISYVVLGAGFNLNRMHFEDDISSFASSVRKETGRNIGRAAFLADFSLEFMERYERFLKEGNLAGSVDEYNRRLINRGRLVKIVRRGQSLVRTSGGINENGELLVYDEEGREETVLSGEVSVRGLYGYV